MRRSVRRGLLAGAVVAALAATAVPAVNAMAAGSIAATFTASSDWGTGHEVAVKVTNGSDAAVATWSITFTLPASTSISSSWDADVTRSGNTYTAVKKSWAAVLPPAHR